MVRDWKIIFEVIVTSDAPDSAVEEARSIVGKPDFKARHIVALPLGPVDSIIETIARLDVELDKVITGKQDDSAAAERSGAKIYDKISVAQKELAALYAQPNHPDNLDKAIDALTEITKNLLVFVFDLTEEQIAVGIENFSKEMTEPDDTAGV